MFDPEAIYSGIQLGIGFRIAFFAIDVVTANLFLLVAAALSTAAAYFIGPMIAEAYHASKERRDEPHTYEQPARAPRRAYARQEEAGSGYHEPQTYSSTQETGQYRVYNQRNEQRGQSSNRREGARAVGSVYK